MPNTTQPPGWTPQSGAHRANEMPPGTYGMEPGRPAWHPSITYLLLLIAAEWLIVTVLLRITWA
jgi:hypothetical protein